jgi:hypothetical protein
LQDALLCRLWRTEFRVIRIFTDAMSQGGLSDADAAATILLLAADRTRF